MNPHAILLQALEGGMPRAVSRLERVTIRKDHGEPPTVTYELVVRHHFPDQPNPRQITFRGVPLGIDNPQLGFTGRHFVLQFLKDGVDHSIRETWEAQHVYN